MVPVIIAQSSRHIVLMRWALVPHWVKDQKTASKMIDARVEMLTQQPAFRGRLSHNCCLVPARGFYEWKGEGRDKTPYYIHPEGQPYLAFAGLYDVWINPRGEELSTFIIIYHHHDRSGSLRVEAPHPDARRLGTGFGGRLARSRDHEHE
jgi:putative SOS response-associated peptidase YedK